MKLKFMIHNLDPIHVRRIQEKGRPIISRICIDEQSNFYGNISGGTVGDAIKQTDYESVGWYIYTYVRLA